MKSKHKFEGKPELEKKINSIMISLSKTWAMAITNMYLKVKKNVTVAR